MQPQLLRLLPAPDFAARHPRGTFAPGLACRFGNFQDQPNLPVKDDEQRLLALAELDSDLMELRIPSPDQRHLALDLHIDPQHLHVDPQ
jgi:hypothetical protein